MTTPHTDRLIATLASEAGNAHDPKAPGFERALLIGVGLSLVAAIAIVVPIVGIRSDILTVVQLGPFHYKIATTLLLAIGAFVLVRRAGQAGATLPLTALAPGLLLLAFGAATDTSGLSPLGGSSLSVPICVSAILLMAVPALVAILYALQRGVPTRPGVAGAMAGLLAGALGAAVYTLSCKNDGGLFVAVWYGTAMLITTCAGAAIGRRTLAW
jgi:hypothetical protein